MDIRVEKFRRIVKEMADLYEKKNSNYGNSFGKLYEDLGPISGLVPLHNKLDRATNLIKGGKNDFESVEDTFKDLACYAIMNLIEMEMEKDKLTVDYKDEDKIESINNYRVTSDKHGKMITVETFSQEQGEKINNLGGRLNGEN